MPGKPNMFAAIEKNLNAGAELVRFISDDEFQDCTVPPYHSSIGCHMRHILDIFDCIFAGLESGKVDLTARKRCTDVETNREACLAYLDRTIDQLYALDDVDMDQLIDVTDDLGLGPVTCKYTLGAALIQAHSHAIHHFAALGYVNSSLGIALPVPEFGYNPTTPRETAVN